MPVKKILILDDDRVRHENFAYRFSTEYPLAKIDHVYTADAAIAALRDNEKYDLVQLDHDLHDFGPYPDTDPKENMFNQVPEGQKEYTGADVCAWMAGASVLTGDKRPDMIVVHSWNSYGSQRMIEILSDAGFTVFQKIFTP